MRSIATPEGSGQERDRKAQRGDFAIGQKAIGQLFKGNTIVCCKWVVDFSLRKK